MYFPSFDSTLTLGYTVQYTSATGIRTLTMASSTVVSTLNLTTVYCRSEWPGGGNTFTVNCLGNLHGEQGEEEGEEEGGEEGEEEGEEEDIGVVRCTRNHSRGNTRVCPW